MIKGIQLNQSRSLLSIHRKFVKTPSQIIVPLPSISCRKKTYDALCWQKERRVILWITRRCNVRCS